MSQAFEILNALEAMHPRKEGWLFLREFRNGTAFRGDAQQRFDALAFHAWPSSKGAPFLRRVFELKVSDVDLANELKNPDKRWVAKAISHEFYWVAPTGLIVLSKIERDKGLIEWDGAKIEIKRRARTRETMPPKWSFVASLIRRLEKIT